MEVPGTLCKLRPSLHAADRMISQGIATGEVLEAILKGAKRREGERVVSTLKGKEVVFVKRPCRYFLVTAYWLT
ncbi:MAG: DUF4258 domain-containing protein [Candidatus Aenigmarchaeota archaeon]|nr:DUF4258 domain-containing protein [Candidatus Aenigmarchaeota archaeon]